MVDKYPVVTLCGSTRFKDEFMNIQKKLTLEGNIVISVGLFSHSGDQDVLENMDKDTLTKTKEMLDDIHKRKIDMADSIFVINVGGYIGESTKSEIEYALSHGKEVKYLEDSINKTCEECGSVFTFNYDDIERKSYTGIFGNTFTYKSVICPVCRHRCSFKEVNDAK